MVGRVFYWVLNMSLGASVVGLLVFLVGKIPRLPRRLACILWAVPLLRLWLPFAPYSRYSLMQLLVRLGSRPVPVPVEGLLGMNFTQAAASYFPLVYRTAKLEQLFAIAGTAWLVISAALLAWMAMSYRAAMGEALRAQPLGEDIYVSSGVDSPAVYGIRKPRILIPESWEGEDLTYALDHERIHICRRDNLWRLVAIGTACVHWFNPLVWLGLRLFMRELELACDECVLENYGEDQRRAYARALLHWAETSERLVSPFGGPQIKTRIGRILSYRRLSALSWTACLVLAAALGYILLTNGG